MSEATKQPQYTRGPWFIFGNGHCVGGPLTDRLPGETATAGVAMCGMRMRLPEECAANARLIAKAPEMLELLREVIPCIDIWDERGIDKEINALIAEVEGTK